jgi:hypothetical protein
MKYVEFSKNLWQRVIYYAFDFLLSKIIKHLLSVVLKYFMNKKLMFFN